MLKLLCPCDIFNLFYIFYFFFWHFEGWIWIRNIWLFEREKWGFSIRSHVCMQVLVKSEASFWSITRPLFYKILYENCWSLNSQCLLSQVPLMLSSKHHISAEHYILRLLVYLCLQMCGIECLCHKLQHIWLPL